MITRIKSDNFNGEVVNITFTPDTGGTINITGVTIPYDYVSDYPYGDYSIFIPSANKTCPLNVPNPIVPTPTITPTSTVTPTPTITPTPTLTPTPSPFVASVSIAPTGTTKYNFISLTGSTNISSPTYVWTLSDFYDYSGNTITSHTGQTTPIGEFRNTGTTLVELVVTGLDPSSNPVTGSSTTFEVIVPTTYRQYFSIPGGTTLYYTNDLITFSSTTTPDTIRGSKITYSPALDIYVLPGNDIIFYSYDGISWSGSSTGVTARYKDALWVPEKQLFIVPADTSNYISISTDGINWTNYGTFSWGSLSTSPLVYDNINDLFILTDGDGDIWTSTGGTSWSLTYTFAGERFSSLSTYSGTTTAVHTSNGDGIYSTDGINWSAITYNSAQTSAPSFRYDILPSGRRVGVGTNAGGFYVSDDGIVVSGVTSPSGLTNSSRGVIYNEVEGKVIFCEENTTNIFLSTDGITYTETTITPNNSFAAGIRYNIT